MSKEDKNNPINSTFSNETIIIDDSQLTTVLGQKRERSKTEEENLKNEVSNISKFENIQTSNTINQIQINQEKLSNLNNQEKINTEQNDNQKEDSLKNSSENFYDFSTKKTLVENNKVEVFCNICKNEKHTLYSLNEISSSKLIKDFLNSKFNIDKNLKNIISLGIDKIFFNQKKLQNKDKAYVCKNCICKEFVNGGIEKIMVLFNKEIFKTNNKNSILDLKEILFMNTKILEKISLINKNCKTTTFNSDSEIKNLQSNLDECLNDLNINNLLLNKFIENYEIIRINNFSISNSDADNKNNFIGKLKNININEQQILNTEKKNKFGINLCCDNNTNNKNIGINFPICNKSEITSINDNNLLEERNESINLLASKNKVGNRKILYTIFTKNAIHEVNNEKYPKNFQTKIFQTDITPEIKRENTDKYNVNTQNKDDNFNLIRNTNNLNNNNLNQNINNSNNVYTRLNNNNNILKDTNNINNINNINNVNNVNNANNLNSINNINSLNGNGKKIVNNPKSKSKMYNQYNESIKNIDCYCNNMSNNINNNSLNNINKYNTNNNIIGNDINNISNLSNNDFNDKTQGNQFKDILVNYLISSLQLNQKLLNQMTDNYKISCNNNNNYIQKNDLLSTNNNILQAINNINTNNINPSIVNNLNQRNNNINFSLNNQNLQNQNNNSLFIRNCLPMKNIPNINNYSLIENNNQNYNINKLYDGLKKYNINNNNIPINENFMNTNFNKTQEPSYINDNNNLNVGYNNINNINNNINNGYNNLNGTNNLNNNMLLMNPISNNFRNNENIASNSFNSIFYPNVYPPPTTLQKTDSINNLNPNFNNQSFNLNIDSNKNNILLNNNINNNFNTNNSHQNCNNCNMAIKNDSFEENKFNIDGLNGKPNNK